MKQLLVTLALGVVVAASEAAQAQREVPLTPGMAISANTRVKPGVYRLQGNATTPALIVRGSNITLDLTGVTIEGGEPYADPDGYVGTGIEIEGGDHVTIKGGAIRGFGDQAVRVGSRPHRGDAGPGSEGQESGDLAGVLGDRQARRQPAERLRRRRDSH